MKSTKQRSIFNNLFRRLTSSRGHAFIVLSTLDADIVKSYAELGLGVVVLLTVAFESDRELRAIKAATRLRQAARVAAVENSATGAFRESVQDQFVSWSEWQDLNLRPPRPERGFHTQKSEIIAGFSFRYTQVPNIVFAPRKRPLRFDREEPNSRSP
jgi:hypothetical protein